MGRRSRKSKRRLNSLFMAVLMSAVLLIVSTYAWFSANREVEIRGITAKVEAAEGLQISLDGASWSSYVEVDGDKLDAVKTYNNFTWPSELRPVSTIGQTDSGSIVFFDGDIDATGAILNNADKALPANKYIVFDVYLKNSSSQEKDPLLLNSQSSVAVGSKTGKVGQTGTGLEYCPRVGFALYPDSKIFSESQANIAAISGEPTVSIWEPNYAQHITEVARLDNRIGNDTNSTFETLALKGKGSGTLTGVNGSTATDFMDTTHTVRTPGTVGSTPENLVDCTDGTSNLEIDGNAISKVTVYIWLEGQDPDCIDTASTGKYLDFQINLAKPAVTP